MRIASTESYITELLSFFDLNDQIVGISHNSPIPSQENKPQIITTKNTADTNSGNLYNPKLSQYPILIDALRSAKPDTVVAAIYADRPEHEVTKDEVEILRAELSQLIGYDIKLASYAPRLLDEIYHASENLARTLKIPYKGDDLGKRAKAQLMDWGDNFYDRMKNKKVTFISSMQPLMLGGMWIPDMIHTLSAHSQLISPAYKHENVSWDQIIGFKPDVIVVAPMHSTLKESMATFKMLEKMPHWEEIPAVKRGEVIFCDGIDHFYNPGPKIIESFGVMVSAIAGLESGYITRRDCFYRLRWMELQRHRL